MNLTSICTENKINSGFIVFSDLYCILVTDDSFLNDNFAPARCDCTRLASVSHTKTSLPCTTPPASQSTKWNSSVLRLCML